MANSLAQGCQASPDLLNILFEPLHHWAAVQGWGVTVDGLQVTTVSYTDDFTLVAESREEVIAMVCAFQRWCTLLGLCVNVAKTQVWSNTGAQHVVLEGVEVATRLTFCIMGIELRDYE
jgi:hypothetical protein